ncbi:MAG: hypothetical protein C0415_03405 [Thermodesulfovibrio sp.]|nr:hypothetical protein [Thermodesulfovibrio sp.]
MSVITRKIGNGKYAYLVLREGKKVIHKYLGRADNPKVVKMLLHKKESSDIPEKLETLFWDANLKKIHVKQNARYIIERVLELGDLDALKWLQKVYPVRTIIDTLYLNRTLTAKSRNFWMLWFGVINA